jgi:hypothetical protein
VLILAFDYFSACDVGHYGQNCSKQCGHCRNDAPCDSISGNCPDQVGGENNVCDDGFDGPKCESKSRAVEISLNGRNKLLNYRTRT